MEVTSTHQLLEGNEGMQEIMDYNNLADSRKRRNPRATKDQISKRENAIMMMVSSGPLDAYTLSKRLNLSVAQVMTIIDRLIRSGKVMKCGRVDNRLTYGKRAEGLVDVASTHLSSSNPPVYLGEKLEVTSILISSDGTQIELRDVNGESRVTLSC